MKSDRVESIVHDFLKQSYEATGVIQKVRAFLDDLRLEGWPEEAVQAVERGVLTSLYGNVIDPTGQNGVG